MGKHDEVLLSQMIEAGKDDQAKLEVWAERNLRRQSIDIRLLRVGLHSGKAQQYHLAEKMEVLEDEVFQSSVAPTMRLDYDSAEVLMNALWYAGVRPQSISAGQGELQAVVAHRDELRAELTAAKQREGKYAELLFTAHAAVMKSLTDNLK